MKTRKWIWSAALVVCVAAVVAIWQWKQDQPRRACIQAATEFQQALQSSDNSKLLQSIAIPDAIAGRTAAEQSEFLRKALADELSSEGLAVLKREGQFGPLTNLFPAEASSWAQQAGVSVDHCSAFKLQRADVQAELVIAREPIYGITDKSDAFTYRIVRCNNVKQLAETHQP